MAGSLLPRRKDLNNGMMMGADKKGFWVSELNNRPEVRKNFPTGRPVQFYDTTLRDGEQSVGVVLTPQQKVEIARGLDDLGVGRIEAGFRESLPMMRRLLG